MLKTKTKLIKTVSISLVLLMALILCGCQSKTTAFSLDLFKTEGIGYCYNGINWYISEAEFESASGMKLSNFEKLESAEDGKTVYMSENEIKYDGKTGYETVEFVEDKLKSITFTFSSFENDTPESFFQKIVTEFEKLYGSPADTKENTQNFNGVDLTTNIYEWNSQDSNGQTSLQAMLSVVGDRYTITIGVAIF